MPGIRRITPALAAGGVWLCAFFSLPAWAQSDQDVVHKELIEVTEAYVVYKMGDHDKAFGLWMALAVKGNRQGMLNIGNMYDAGQSVPQDFAKALEWYRKAAEFGEPIGMFAVAQAYDKGRGVAANPAEAARHYRMAAEGGYGEAQVWLAEKLIADGKMGEAHGWLEKAAAKGESRAIALLKATPEAPMSDYEVDAATGDRARRLLADLDDATNRKDTAGMLRPIAPDAVITIDLASGGRRERRAITRPDYEALWRETFAQALRYRFSRVSTKIVKRDAHTVEVESRIRETLGSEDKARTIELVETLTLDMSPFTGADAKPDAPPRITRVHLVVDAPPP